MKALFLIAIGIASISTANAQVHVRGHVRSDGVYVPPHERTEPNSTKTDNWSSRPNVNPYTGREGTVDPYKPADPYKPYRPK